MSSQERQPTRVSMTVGSTSRHGGEFEFRKISLSLDRDLAALENPVDAYRDIKALLERMVTEFQGPKPAGTSTPAGTPSPAGNGNRAAPPRPAASKPTGLQLEILHERLAKWLPELEIMDGFDGFAVKPKRYLDQSWKDVNDVVRSLGGHWTKGQTSKDGSWRIPK